MERGRSVTIDLPAHVISMHAALARLHIGPAGADIVLHANRLILFLSELDGTTIWGLDASLTVFALILASTLTLALLRVVLRVRLESVIGWARTWGIPCW